MATTEEILAKAVELGKLIAEHPATAKMEAAVTKLQADTEAQHLLNDYNRCGQAIAQKEASNQTIEVAEKHQLQELQEKMMGNALLGEVQMAQMDYLDLMRRVDAAMSGKPEEAAQVGPAPGGMDIQPG